MASKLLEKLTRLIQFGSPRTPRLPKAKVIPRDAHPISRKQVSRAALNVLYGLHKAGFEAYLVGGCLRDLLCGRQPKDFDVVTDATPEQVYRLFKRSRIIGRRFQIVHVRFGGEVIEVSTFRAFQRDDDLDDDQHRAHEETGLVLRDNTWGSIEEDALRRDFTINALYYNIADFALYDFVNSRQDIERGVIRLIGDPQQRYREDPVRMLRAARFAAKLGFQLDRATRAPIPEMAPLLLQVPPARLFDEVLKLFLSGHARESFEQLRKLGLFAFLFPNTHEALESEQGEVWERLILAAMDNTDRRLSENKPVTPAFLYAVFLWPVLVTQLNRYREDGIPPAPALHKAATWALNEQSHHTSVPRRFSSVMREMWDLQPRLDKRNGKRADTLMEHPRFRAAYDFLLLREQAGEIKPGLGEWWTRYQAADESQQRAMVQDLGQAGRQGGRRRRRRRRSGGGGDSEA
ncbi:polynucleotide adenylyltransferase PcnB [Alloalcanivorax xenomutans]|uniref:Poly(A) polymerase I n=1 Tax=Alloalcanivorax xenomutans TaxID=1094342 RepID=A0A9Q3W9W7_9GAMM|nr:polynucleotide adenylyltransferase PcnB [Alloalcanivorax xenomutans]ARB47151.1 poly(A) polymerase [Alloalcanivorax xenomutans]MBA4721223.1 polynucleotide adenylyltransferase PcnB [Alcanivorax sp.]MCE7510792.1 polynucleotide adenylyltransferase PcnB [Alloalcanivorax xenomutans]WOD27856.1 polynucleotide adenylyltransferase PcnB [Alloalcanivorax xenomutans]